MLPKLARVILCTALLTAGLWQFATTDAVAQEQSTSSALQKQVGTIKAISGNRLTLATDAGSESTVVVEDSARIVRTAPGQKDLKDATPAHLQDLQVGDRILARGKPSDDGKNLTATTVIVMKGTDIAAKQQQEREDWQKRGIGGLVTSVDDKGGAVVVSTSTLGSSKTTTIHLTKDTVIRRYAPDSVKFDDASPGALPEIKTGDQLRARGTKSPDGNDLTADEIVSGTFRSIAATVVTTDASDNSLRVTDLVTKKQITLKISGDSQLRTLPPMMAQRIAARLKGGQTPAQTAQPNPAVANSERPGGGFGGRPGVPPDFQQILSRMPTVSLSDLQKGTPVMIVATEGTDTHPPTTITLLTGVEPILTAAPDSGRAAMLLSPWNLGGADMASAAGGNP